MQNGSTAGVSAYGSPSREPSLDLQLTANTYDVNQGTNPQVLLEEIQQLREMVASLNERLDAVAANGQTSTGDINTTDSLSSQNILNLEGKGFDIREWLQTFNQRLNDEGQRGLRTGICFKNLRVSGSKEALRLQETTGDFLLGPLARAGRPRSTRKKILHGFKGLVRSGELLLVLGRPGAGCSTLLKALCGRLHGLQVHNKSLIHYNGIPQRRMVEEFKGEMTYNEEVSYTWKPELPIHAVSFR